ncbi:hypothetical protein HanIR_Chr03g0119961 [Helianthus annuus]|nr:hypothetical protein HanIR_Chr03g0119961 [Helianthus annuus]
MADGGRRHGWRWLSLLFSDKLRSDLRRQQAQFRFNSDYSWVKSRPGFRVSFRSRSTTVKRGQCWSTARFRVFTIRLSVQDFGLGRLGQTELTRLNLVNSLSQLSRSTQSNVSTRKIWNIVECTLVSPILETTSRSRN